MPKEVKQKSGLIRGINKGHVSFTLWFCRCRNAVVVAGLHATKSFDRPWRNSSRWRRFVSIAMLRLIPIRRNNVLTEVAKQKVSPVTPPARISKTKGRATKRTSFVRDVVKEVAGLVKFLYDGVKRKIRSGPKKSTKKHPERRSLAYTWPTRPSTPSKTSSKANLVTKDSRRMSAA